MKRLAILAAAVAGLAVPALAHAFLEKASPAAGENLHAAPAKIALHFSEALEPAFSGVTVTSAAGADMRAGPPSVSGGEIDQPLKPLAPGRYRVTWHAVSVDTHRTAGKYNFLVLP
jgi:methionine-rich copper-binding protein CopC